MHRCIPRDICINWFDSDWFYIETYFKNTNALVGMSIMQSSNNNTQKALATSINSLQFNKTTCAVKSKHEKLEQSINNFSTVLLFEMRNPKLRIAFIYL